MAKKMLAVLTMAMLAVNCFAAVGIQVSPNSWTAGTGGAGAYASDENYFGVHNMGDQPANIKIRAGNMTPSGWILADIPGQNQFSLEWKEGGYWHHISASDSMMNNEFPVAVGSIFNFALQLKSPTSINP